MNIEIGWEIFVINKNLSVFNKDFSAFLLTSLFLKTTKISRAVLYRVSAFHENPIGHSKGRKFWLMHAVQYDEFLFLDLETSIISRNKVWVQPLNYRFPARYWRFVHYYDTHFYKSQKNLKNRIIYNFVECFKWFSRMKNLKTVERFYNSEIENVEGILLILTAGYKMVRILYVLVYVLLSGIIFYEN